MGSSPGFGELASRLVQSLRERVRAGEISERGLARLTGYSQPHIHNVLKGKRQVSVTLADQIMRLLSLPLLSFLGEEDLAGRTAAAPGGALPVPILQGRLGGGRIYPRETSRSERFFLPASSVARFVRPVMVRLDGSEWSMWPHLRPGDLVMVDRSPSARRRPEYDHIYALFWRRRSYLARCRLAGQALVVGVEKAPRPAALPEKISLARRNILDVVRGRVVWLGRDLEVGSLAAPQRRR